MPMTHDAKKIKTLTSADFLDPNLPMDFMLTGLWRPYPEHQHEFIEINFITNGTVVERVNDNLYRLTRGNVVILTPGDTHDTPWAGKATGMLVRYLPEKCNINMDSMESIPGYKALFVNEEGKPHKNSVLKLDDNALHEAEEILIQMGREFRQKRPGYGIQMHGLLYQYIVLLCRQYTHVEPLASYGFARLLKAIKYIEFNYKENIDIKKLADIAGMTRRTFLRNFRSATGITPIQYLIHHRVSTAAVYLRNSAHPIENVARASGFPDSNYFARQFKKVMHMTPTEYRKHGHSLHNEEDKIFEEIHFPKNTTPET